MPEDSCSSQAGTDLQAHSNAQAHADEFVKAAFIAFDKISLLVHLLLVTEVGRLS